MSSKHLTLFKFIRDTTFVKHWFATTRQEKYAIIIVDWEHLIILPADTSNGA